MTERKKTNKGTRKLVTVLLAFAMAFTLVAAMPVNPMATVSAASKTIITGGEGTLEGTLSTDEAYKVEVDDCCLKVTVGTSTYKFRNYLNIVGIATVAEDDLLHILTLSGKYYVVDLRYGSFVTIEVWRNSSTSKYAVKSSDSYEVFGSTIVDTKYFYERVSVNSVSRERLVNRAEFDAIVNPGGSSSDDPSDPSDPTPSVTTKYSVGFNTNGGSYIADQIVEKGQKVIRPTDPTKSGYTFAGWYADSALTSPFDFNTPITSETTLYAKWTENGNSTPTPVSVEKFMVSFNTNGGSYVASQIVEAGSKANRPTDPTKSGYTFAGWFADSNLTSSFDFNTPINANTIVYAKWTDNGNSTPTPVSVEKFMVSFNTNGGSYVASQIVEAGSKALRPSDPTKSGYTFAGWFADSNLTSSFDFNTPINANTTVYAKWTETKKEQQPSTENVDTGDWPEVEWPTLDDKPSTEQPKTETPTSEQPKTEIPTSEQPTTDTKITGEFDIDWWYAKYAAGNITWEQLMQVLYKYQWKAAKEENSKEITYYFYDDNGNLIRTEKVGKTVEQSAGVGEGSANVDTKGAANVKVAEKEAGTATVKVELETTTTGGSNDSASAAAAAEAAKAAAEAAKAVSNVAVTNNSNSSKTETYYHVKRKGKKVTLECRKAKKTGAVCSVYFNKKKHIAKYDGITYKNIKYVGYTQGSRMILMITRKNKVYIVPRNKGEIGKIYTKRVLKGKWKLAIEDNAGLVIRVSDKKSKVKGVKDATPKKIKTDKY